MADPRFFNRAGPFSLEQLALHCGAELSGTAEADLLLNDVAALDIADRDQISFLDNRKYVEKFVGSHAGACLIRPDMASKAPAGMALLLCKDPYRAYAQIASLFYPLPIPQASIAATASVDDSALLGTGCQVDAGAVISAGAEIGPGCHIGANAVIGARVVIGAHCIVGANATISHAIIGNRVFIHPGVCIGQDGFGFAMGAAGHLKVPQLGRVLIHDDVEIGANSTIDRGAGPDTVIGAGCKIDKLVQIGHNVQLGRGCVMAAQSGISGSSKLGDFVIIAGQVGIAGHLTIGSGARFAGQAGVMRDVAPGETVGGTPSVPMTQWLRQTALLGQLAQKKGR